MTSRRRKKGPNKGERLTQACRGIGQLLVRLADRGLPELTETVEQWERDFPEVARNLSNLFAQLGSNVALGGGPGQVFADLKTHFANLRGNVVSGPWPAHDRETSPGPAPDDDPIPF